MRRLLASLLIVLAITHSGAQSPQGTDPQQIFRTGVDIVRLDVTVLDKNRQPIPGPSPGQRTHRAVSAA
jgi:hypothetical protein